MSNLMRVSQVMGKTGLAKSTVWAWVAAGRFPKPLKLSTRVAVWPEDQVDAWVSERMEACADQRQILAS